MHETTSEDLKAGGAMLKVVFHEDFYQVYTGDPAAAAGRIEAIVDEIEDEVEFVAAVPATDTEISAVHSTKHISYVQYISNIF